MIREKLFGMVAMVAPRHDLHWRMTPVAFTKVRLAEDRNGDMISTGIGHRPTCLGIPVEIVSPQVYGMSEIALGAEAPMVPL